MREDASIVFRTAQVADARAIAQVQVESWRQAYSNILPRSMLASLCVDTRESTWKNILSQPEEYDRTTVFLALQNKQVCGFASCGDQRAASLRDAGYSGEVSSIYVLESHQRLGVGKELLLRAFTALFENLHAGIGIWVLSDNLPACKFYERRGGQQVACRNELRDNATVSEIAYGWTSSGIRQ